jgi:hypothetical protein
MRKERHPEKSGGKLKVLSIETTINDNGLGAAYSS